MDAFQIIAGADVGDPPSAEFDYKWGDKDWRSQEAETFQKVKSVRTIYSVYDGQILGTSETTSEYASAVAGVALTPTTGPPYIYGDGTWHADEHEIFQATHVKLVAYEAFGDGAYRISVEEFDPITGKTVQATPIIVDGKMPLAPNVRSGISHLVRRPVVQQVLTSPGDFLDTKANLDLPWAEDEQDMLKAERRAIQRATAVTRKVKRAANPLIQLGDTVRLIGAGRKALGDLIVTRRKFTVSPQGAADMELEGEWWPDA